MFIRHIARASDRNSLTAGSRLFRIGLGALLLAASISGQHSAAAADPVSGGAAMGHVTTLTRLQPESGSITGVPDKDITLSVARKIDGQGSPGQEVDWTVDPKEQATLTPGNSVTTTRSASGTAGIASTVFHANAPGDYTVTATTQKNPGCSGPSCATYVSLRYKISIATTPIGASETTNTTSSSGGINQNEVIAAVVGLGGAIAIAENSNNNNGAAVMLTLASVSGNGQSATANAPLAQPLVVHAENNGVSAASVGVRWSASGGAVLSSPVSVTDATGTASVNVVSVGPGPGPITITATRSDDSSATVSFTANVLIPSLAIVSGNGQSGFTNTQVAKPLVVEAGLGGAAEPGVPIKWAVVGGSATIVSSVNTTNGSGQASAIIEFGANPGPVQITATRTDNGLSETFQLTSNQTFGFSMVSGNGQSGFGNTQAAKPLVVEAKINNMPQSGVPIMWLVESGSATIVSSVNTTTGSGQASAIIKYGPTPGPIQITATRTDNGLSQTFNLTSIQATALLSVSGNNQTGYTNSDANHPLVVEAELDDLPQSGVPIAWTVHSGSATIASSINTTTGSGQASAVIKYGPTPGPIEITATRTDTGLSQTFQMTSVLTQSLAIFSGNNQPTAPNAAVANPLVVQAKNNKGNVSGVMINWTFTGGNGTKLSSATSVTNSNGLASITVTDIGYGLGPVFVTATRLDDPSATVMFTETILPPTLSIFGSGNNQSGLIGSPAAAALDVTLVNGAGKPIIGQTVSFAVISGSATLSASSQVTNSSGWAPITFTYGDSVGTIKIQATAPGVVTPVIFIENAVDPSSLTIVGAGSGQSGAPGTILPKLLTVQVQPPTGVTNLSGVPITFSVTSGSASIMPDASCPATTNSAGQACAQVKLGLTPGAVQVTAQVAGGPPSALFNERVNGALVTTVLHYVSGSGQAIIPQATSLPLIVKLTDSSNAPIAGQTITWSAAGGTLSAYSTTTVSNGETSVKVTPTGSGAITVTANFPAYAQYIASGPVTFSESTAALVPTALTIASGNSQAIIPNSGSKPLVVQLKAGSSLLGGQTINWSTSGGSLSNASTTTNGSGNTSVTVTPANAGPFTVIASFPGHAQYAATQVTFSENTALASLPTQSSNVQSVGAALDTACSSLQGLSSRTSQQQDLLNQCLALNSSSSVSTPATVNAIHQLTPDVTETQTQTATTATTAQFNNLSDRMTALRGGAQGVSLSGLSFTNENGNLPLFDVGSALLGADEKPKQDSSNAFSRWGFFASGQIGRQDASAQGQAPAYDLDISGLTFGVDYRETDTLVLGGAVGYTHQTTTLANDDGNLSMNGWSLSGYATWYQKNNWYLDSSLTWANNNYNSQRHIDYTLPLPDGSSTSVDQLAQASSGGNDLAGSLTFGRDFNSKAWAYGFYGKAQYSRQSFDAFQETLNDALPGSGLGLRVGSRTLDQLDSVLGAKLDYTMSTSWGVVIPHAEAEWQHEFDGDPNSFQAFFVDDPTNTPILITGTPIDQNFFRLGLGISFVFPQGRSAFILYDRTLGETGITQYNLSLGFRMEF